MGIDPNTILNFIITYGVSCILAVNQYFKEFLLFQFNFLFSLPYELDFVKIIFQLYIQLYNQFIYSCL